MGNVNKMKIDLIWKYMHAAKFTWWMKKKKSLIWRSGGAVWKHEKDFSYHLHFSMRSFSLVVELLS